MTSSNTPHETLLQALITIRGRSAYVVPMTWKSGRALGNNGDALLHEVFYAILEALDVRLVTNPADAAVALVPPNGALLDTYAFPSILAQHLVGLKHLPLYIFPSSAYFREVDPAEMFRGRQAPTVWFLREANSLRHLQERWSVSLAGAGVELVLDHDVVASAGAGLANYFPANSPTAGYILVAARADREATTAALTHSPADNVPALPQRLARFAWRSLPESPLGTAIARRVKASSSAIQADRLLSRIPDEAWLQLGLEPRGPRALRTINVDVSSRKLATYSEYKQFIAGASVVVSDRLHVALPGALLGKPTLMLEAGYHKLGGVYERSLGDLPNVRYMER